MIHIFSQYLADLSEAGILRTPLPQVPQALQDLPVQQLTYDSRESREGTLFIVKGAHFEQRFLEQAITDGAFAFVASEEFVANLSGDVTSRALPIAVSDLRAALVILGQRFYNHVTDELFTVGITGTKGKSTTAFYLQGILHHWLTAKGEPGPGLLSSIRNDDGVTSEISHLTTPEVLDLYQHFANAKRSGIEHMVMEVSSQALKYGRVAGMNFDVAAFTNIGTDHISPVEHPSFEDYYASKLKIFDRAKVALINSDADLAQETISYARERARVLTFGSHPSDDFYCERIESQPDGSHFWVKSEAYNGEFVLGMPGLFNVSNALCAMAVASEMGVPEEFVRSALLHAYVPGRMLSFTSDDGQIHVIVDYAHNRMSFEALFESARLENPGAKIIAIFGAPGGKAYDRREDLGQVAGERADYVYLTEDEPAEENYLDIAHEIESHMGSVPHEIIEDRPTALERAIFDHSGERVILFLGKGEERTMKRGTTFFPIESDADATRRLLAQYNQ